MMTLGQVYLLEVVKVLDFGFYLDAKELGEILLPNRTASKNLSIGDMVEVFLYLDSEGRSIATMQKPKANVGEFAYLKVVANTKVGSFVDWGLDKDILVPFSEQNTPMEEGKFYLVHIYIDKRDARITASSKIDKFVSEEKLHSFKAEQAVDLIISHTTDLGYKAIINHSHWGVLYKTEVPHRLVSGKKIKGFIKHIRSDGKIDLSLECRQKNRTNHVALIEDYLKSQNGFAPIHDKSDPKLILELFGISKGAFKKAIGSLYKQGVIRIEKEGICLAGKNKNKSKNI